MESKIFKILGVRVIPFVNEETPDYRSRPFMDFRFEVLLTGTSGEGRVFELSLSTSHGMCGSGYTTASWSTVALREVLSGPPGPGPLTHRPLRTLAVELECGKSKDSPNPEAWDVKESFDCEFFSWSDDGGDYYYPRGGVDVVLDGNFEATGRGRGKPMVHVFLGGSALGKSTLGAALGGLTVYETDSKEDFGTEMCYANVIVLGEKHVEQTFGGIESFFKDNDLDVELVPVRFGHNVRMEV